MEQIIKRLEEKNRKLRKEKDKLLKLLNLLDEIKEILVPIANECKCRNLKKAKNNHKLNDLLNLYENEKNKDGLEKKIKINEALKVNIDDTKEESLSDDHFDDNYDPDYQVEESKLKIKLKVNKKNVQNENKLDKSTKRNVIKKDNSKKERILCVWPGCEASFFKRKIIDLINLFLF